jgi:hypothetical protein
MFEVFFALDVFQAAQVFPNVLVLAFLGSSRAHHDVRLKKSVAEAPISSYVINKMRFIYGQHFFS